MKTKILIVLIILICLGVGGFFIYKKITVPEEKAEGISLVVEEKTEEEEEISEEQVKEEEPSLEE
ncbi:MAG: hypothetical protein KAS87_06870, partial [Candidatus Omnitrophica bacterium]|nr:hypothetical protein [Candidatus Omnitrophota bacterium]